jgi:hypothetical protein
MDSRKPSKIIIISLKGRKYFTGGDSRVRMLSIPYCGLDKFCHGKSIPNWIGYKRHLSIIQ